MKRFITPTFQISVGLLSLTMSLIFIAVSFGLVPNGAGAALEARGRISENLAIQLANLAGRNDTVAIKETMESVISRNPEILSIAIRGADGKLLVEAGGHDVYWIEPADGKSTATHMLVPLRDADAPQGGIEIVFRPLDTKENILGVPRAIMPFIGFIGIAGFAGYYFVLKRSLRELDPGRAIPERVKEAFDTLAEGVLIMDEREYVLLVNEAFVKNIYTIPEGLLGIDASELPWLLADEGTQAPELPWRAAMRDEKPVLGVSMGIHDRFGNQRRLLVNATRILDGRGTVRGVIATFDDVTVLHQTNEQLHISIDHLHISQLKISEQNQQLQRLATSDPLTGCLNRRTFFAEAEVALQNARRQSQRLSFLMLDADHFKSINDRFGHVTGDRVLIGLVDVMKQICGEGNLVGRYGGEEFCILSGISAEQDVERLADEIRLAISGVATWLPNGERVTVSIGIASLTDVGCEIADMVKRADEALYAAKTSGRNRFVNWSRMSPQSQAPGLRPAQTTGRKESPTPSPVLAKSRVAQKSHDELTGLPSGEAAIEYIDAMIRDDIGGRCFAIARIDIGNLEYFNDRYGRNVADALLVKISQRIVSKIRRSDMLARLNANEFLLLLEPFEGMQQIEPIVERVRNELKHPFLMEEHELFCSCCIGVSVYPEHGRSYEDLRRNADNAMFQAKQSAKGEVVFFDINMMQAATARMEAEQRLRRAVRDRRFCCAFQPKVDIMERRVVGFEALVRLRDDDGEIHLPDEFIGLATELGLIDQITNCVLDIVIKSVDQLDAAFGSGTTVSINVAATLANDLEFMLPFTRAIRDSKVPDRIILELTEDSFIPKGAFQSVIVPILRDIGIRVSIDDFGTGYSSLSALADITADEIKVDRSFISGIHRRPRNQSILRAINSLGFALNMTIVAEGVETFEELAYLQAATSIRQAQGFYFSEPFYLEDMSGANNFLSERRLAEA
ncbi:diguanylate cyclase [Bradyrhizobium sp. LTSP885]|uniref:bifunctional diguanylate cyclase/phosphodiesterase n=1 Tax=Bradyrhizobium sp. LTSP885 TaxID=1619232 RepID=UPI00069B9105|nr:diguanylate cyclase [Bradyrhizobium sp. LTSP885]